MTKKIEFKPDFIGIGVMKAATSWIFECLRAHPEICVASKKEIHFFDMMHNYKKGLEFYSSFFNHCPPNKIKGEFTPAYIISPDAYKLIYKHYPNVKLIVCLRNPIERAFSHYRFNYEMKGRLSIYKNFMEALKKDKELVERGFYFEQLKKYFSLFREEQILILFFSDLINNPKNFIQRIYRFLNLKNPYYAPSLIKKKILETGRVETKFKIPILFSVLYKSEKWLNKHKILKSLIEKSKFMDIILKLVDFNKKISYTNNKEKETVPPLKTEEQKYLYQIYNKSIQNLEKFLDKDLNHWKFEKKN